MKDGIFSLFSSFFVFFLPIFAPELLSPPGVFMRSQGLAEVHASVACLFSHREGGRRWGEGAREPTANQEVRRREQSWHFLWCSEGKKKCAIVRLNASMTVTLITSRINTENDARLLKCSVN